MEAVKIFLMPCGAPSHCTCAVEKTETGDIILPDLNLCAFTIGAHEKAIEPAKEILKPPYPQGD